MAHEDVQQKRSFWWSMRGFFAALGALVTTVIAVVGLFLPPKEDEAQPHVTIENRSAPAAVAPPAQPQPQPQPQSQPQSQPQPQPPTTMLGTIDDVQAIAADACCSFSVKVSLVGFKDETCTLTPTLVSAIDGSHVDGDPVLLIAEADSDTARVDIPVAVEQPGSYRVRFVLRDPDGTELERVETDAFDA